MRCTTKQKKWLWFFSLYLVSMITIGATMMLLHGLVELLSL
jgi:hypothetical protein